MRRRVEGDVGEERALLQTSSSLFNPLQTSWIHAAGELANGRNLTAPHIHTSRLPETASCSNATTWGAVDLSEGPRCALPRHIHPRSLARVSDRRAVRSLRSASAGFWVCALLGEVRWPCRPSASAGALRVLTRSQVHRSTRTRALTPAAWMLAAPRVHAVVPSRARERQRVELVWH
mgnify:CR=1 FL=1